MGLVDYSESSGSEDEAPPKPTVSKPSTATGKKPFQKVVDRSNPGKILVNLPSSKPEAPTSSDEPPAKRARTGGKGGLFSGLNSFLPPPKNTAKTAAPPQSSKSSSRPVFQLKTGAEPGFSCERGDETSSGDGGINLSAPKAAPQPSILEGLKPADEVKLVGKPMMFKPLSVARKPKKKTPVAKAPKVEPTGTQESPATEHDTPAPMPPPKKVSLFSIEPEEPAREAITTATTAGAYEPLFETDQAAQDAAAYAEYANTSNFPAPSTAPSNSNSLDNIADDLNLSAAARRELFGRQKGGAAPQTASRVINFNTDEEYKHNEILRASGQQQIHNPVRSIAPGKHSLKQLVNSVQNNREALEDSFAQGKNNRKEASNRYGW
ncbi:hypothetical protein C8034_v001162 [Colletotrichum sidae]|uniref:Uncharacterized protein n=1 Tax=Colletotrichum sidae TaxID=1347389 RepID=A0A4R8TE26_9PEZI|nr:hypothetical protein C8034_v001162 [Colletotrichum sidae]